MAADAAHWPARCPGGTLVIMAKGHKWKFVARFRAKAYGWRGSALAIKRLKEAVNEIKKAAKTDPVLAADGAVTLMERLWPALQGIDSSSGALGNAVRRTLEEVLPVLIAAPADLRTRTKWTERLYDAVVADGVDYLAPVEDAWGDICAFPELAQRWVDELLEPMRDCWSREGHGWFDSARICLSSLLKTEQYGEIDVLLALEPHRFWFFDKFAAEARVRQGRIEEALAIAETSSAVHSSGDIACFCERVLLDVGCRDEAYRKYAWAANGQVSYLKTYQAIVKKYPERDPRRMLLDFVARSTSKGKWFAAAKDSGFLDVALKCAESDGAEPATLARAARDFAEEDPVFAMQVALAAIRHALDGRGYEPQTSTIILAYDSLKVAAAKAGKTEEAKSAVEQLLQRPAAVEGFGPVMRRALRAHVYLCETGPRTIRQR